MATGKRYETRKLAPLAPQEIDGRVVSVGGRQKVTVRVWEAGVTLAEARAQAAREARELAVAKRRRRKSGQRYD